MTARVLTKFCAFLLQPEIGQFSPDFGAIALLLHRKQWKPVKRKNSTGETDKTTVETLRQKCADFCPLSCKTLRASCAVLILHLVTNTRGEASESWLWPSQIVQYYSKIAAELPIRTDYSHNSQRNILCKFEGISWPQILRKEEHFWGILERGEKTPTPKISALLRKQPVLLRVNFVLTKHRKRKMHREGSCSKRLGVLSKVQMRILVLGVGVFSLLPNYAWKT